MRGESRDKILMSVSGVCFALNIVLLSLSDPSLQVLVVAGWVVLAIGASFSLLSFFTLRRKSTKNVIDSGIYGIVRHPMYVGAMVMFLSHILFGQSWMVAIITVVAIICCFLIIRSADERNVAKFGDEYRRYMKKVPRMNLLAGTMRLVRPKRSRNW